jgi:predicted SprT family Zn-dependent metalloprotease
MRSNEKVQRMLSRKAAKYKLFLVFRELRESGGEFHAPDQVVINPKQSRRSMVSCFYHELAHARCYRYHIYYEYHHDEHKESEHSPRLRLHVEKEVARMGKRLYTRDGMVGEFGRYLDNYLSKSEEEILSWMKRVG